MKIQYIVDANINIKYIKIKQYWILDRIWKKIDFILIFSISLIN